MTRLTENAGEFTAEDAGRLTAENTENVESYRTALSFGLEHVVSKTYRMPFRLLGVLGVLGGKFPGVLG